MYNVALRARKLKALLKMNDQDFQSIGGKWEVPYIDNLFDIDPNLRDYEKDIRKR